MSLRHYLLLVALLLGAIGPGCAAPVLPLPPPTALQEGPPDMDGIVTIMGDTLEPHMWVSCVNSRTEEGILVRSDRATSVYVIRIAASGGDPGDLTDGDELQVRQFRDFSETGQANIFRVTP